MNRFVWIVVVLIALFGVGLFVTSQTSVWERGDEQETASSTNSETNFFKMDKEELEKIDTRDGASF